MCIHISKSRPLSCSCFVDSDWPWGHHLSPTWNENPLSHNQVTHQTAADGLSSLSISPFLGPILNNNLCVVIILVSQQRCAWASSRSNWNWSKHASIIFSCQAQTIGTLCTCTNAQIVLARARIYALKPEQTAEIWRRHSVSERTEWGRTINVALQTSVCLSFFQFFPLIMLDFQKLQVLCSSRHPCRISCWKLWKKWLQHQTRSSSAWSELSWPILVQWVSKPPRFCFSWQVARHNSCLTAIQQLSTWRFVICWYILGIFWAHVPHALAFGARINLSQGKECAFRVRFWLWESLIWNEMSDLYSW